MVIFLKDFLTVALLDLPWLLYPCKENKLIEIFYKIGVDIVSILQSHDIMLINIHVIKSSTISKAGYAGNTI